MNLDRLIAVRNDKNVYRDGRKCIKAFAGTYTKSDLLREAFNQEVLGEAGLRVPVIDSVSKIGDQWMIVSDYIKGKSLAQLIGEEPARRDEYLELFTRLQKDIHKRRAPKLFSLEERLTYMIGQTPCLEPRRDEFYAMIRSLKPDDHICHGDFNLSNVLMTDAGETYIVDCAYAAHGSGEFDAAVTFLLTALRLDREAAEVYLQLFCGGSRARRQRIEALVPLAAAMRLYRCFGDEYGKLMRYLDIPEVQPCGND